jgi:lipopolysaccharide/colanic/teichoic acid biosynthesis glycosyltransferase
MIRFFDIIISFFGLIILSPLFSILAILIKLDSKGPILFKQLRVGKDFKDFYLLKFRSMGINTEHLGYLTFGERDPRITRFGYYIRKFKLDELPQLVNVLAGDMSLVGPRPEVRKYTDLYTDEQKIILSVRPGITDYASISYRNENEILSQSSNPEEYYIQTILPEKIRLNMEYIQHRNLVQYFKILILTLF